MNWRQGDVVLIQHVWRGRVFSAAPARVVEDRGASLVLWCAAGSNIQMAWPPSDRDFSRLHRIEPLLDCLSRGDWIHEEQELATSALWFLEAGTGYGIAHFRHARGHPVGWYINLQEPYRRTEHGIQTMDLALDVIVDRQGTWRWKDEDEFRALIEHGLLDAHTATWVRREGWAAIRRLEARLEPFDGEWEMWQPPPEWTAPALEDGWDRL